MTQADANAAAEQLRALGYECYVTPGPSYKPYHSYYMYAGQRRPVNITYSIMVTDARRAGVYQGA